jgi:hypothetical protein
VKPDPILKPSFLPRMRSNSGGSGVMMMITRIRKKNPQSLSKLFGGCGDLMILRKK